MNLSSRTLSSAEESVLSKGLNFAPAPSMIPAAHMVAAVESGLRCLPEEAAKLARTKVPLRPIVSFLRSPTHQLLKHLATILSPLVGNSPSHVRNSKAFTEFIKPQVLSSEELLVSFDVVSLFTNVPVHLATEVVQRRLKDDVDLKNRTGLNVKEVMMLLELCLSATFRCFRGGVYQQTFGTAMGSPVSVTIANLVMEDVEERALATTDIPLRFWKRYVDVTCAELLASRVQ